MEIVKLGIPLADDDEFGYEWVPFFSVGDRFRLVEACLYVGGISVGDEISVVLDTWDDGVPGRVKSWTHVYRSGNSTVWLMRVGADTEGNLKDVLGRLSSLGCSVVDFRRGGRWAIDVPEAVRFDDVDALLELLDEEVYAIAFPSMRHPDDDGAGADEEGAPGGEEESS